MINKIKNYLKLQKQLWFFRKMFKKPTLIQQSRYSFHNINDPNVKTFIVPIGKLTPKDADVAISNMISHYKEEIIFNDLTGEITLDSLPDSLYSKEVWLPSPQYNTMFICDEQLKKNIKQKYAQTEVNSDYYQEIKISEPDSHKIVLSSVYGEFDKQFQIYVNPNDESNIKNNKLSEERIIEATKTIYSITNSSLHKEFIIPIKNV